MADVKSYYGPFVWLAVVSFAVPLVVAAKAFQEVRPTTKPTPQPDAAGVDHALWDYLLRTYVENGLVDYDGLRRDYLLSTYLGQLARAEWSQLRDPQDQLALLCNAYNAFVIQGVLNHRIENSVMDYRVAGREFFDLEEHIFCGRTVSLNQLEHDIIRQQYRDPRVHMALVCAARSCPAIRPEAYLGPQLGRQLEDQARRFANDRRYVDLDETSGVLRLSPLLNWYGDDWRHLGGYLPWLAARVEDPATRQAIERAARGEVRTQFLDYDWSLNTTATLRPATAGTPQGKAEFGSGSIPNQ